MILITISLLICLTIPEIIGEKLEHDGKILRTRGDIVLGGIFPMHEHSLLRSSDYPCGAVKEEKGVQRLEAMLYAIDLINADPNILPNITLGVLIIDSCSSETYALEQSMEFVRTYMNQDLSEYECESGNPPTFVPHKPVVGVIGASFSVVSIMVANILRLFKIPQISYASTSTELSDKSRFEYFSRVVPPDNFQAQAMAEVVQALNWLYVSTVAVEGDYGEKGIASFVMIAAELGICIAVSEKISRNAKNEDFDRIIENLYRKPNARAIVMFVDEDNVRKLLQASIRANRVGHFYWIASDSWGAKVYPVRDQEYAAVNSITVLPHRNNLQGFDDYFKSLRPNMDHHACTNGHNIVHPDNKGLVINCRNSWFNEFWEQHNKCTFDKRNTSSSSTKTTTATPSSPSSPSSPTATKRCTGSETVDGYEQEGLVPFVVDAVYAMAHALHDYITEKCKDVPISKCDLSGPELLKYIHKLSFTGEQGTKIRFNEDGDAFGFYNIFQYQQKIKGKYDYVEIGTWKEGLDLNLNAIRFEGGAMPNITCSDECSIGHVRNYQDICCWSCVKCREDAYVQDDTCESCELGWAPNINRTGCEKLVAEVMLWTDPWAIVPLSFAIFGICSSLFTIGVFIKFHHTPVIKASGRELCYVLLFGTLFCYSMTFIILERPNVFNCFLLRMGLGLGLSICYGAIFIKTNRISRIFNSSLTSAKRPSYTSPVSQLIFVLIIVAFQVGGSIVWLCVDPVDVQEIHPYPLASVLACKVSTLSMVLSLAYNMVLIVLCTIYAFKTRKIPENFNEAKYIGFTMYSTCIVWLAFLPIYFGSDRDYKIQVSSLCMCVSISATAILGCLFTPKVYLVLFQPEKNVRAGIGYNTVYQHGQEIQALPSSAGIRFRWNTAQSHAMHSATNLSPNSPSIVNYDGCRIQTLSQTVESNIDEVLNADQNGDNESGSVPSSLRQPTPSRWSRLLDGSSVLDFERDLRPPRRTRLERSPLYYTRVWRDVVDMPHTICQATARKFRCLRLIERRLF